MQEHLENKCPPIGAETLRNDSQTPPPAYGLHEQVGVPVDPQWLQSVSGACGEYNQQMLAAQAMALGQRGGIGGAYSPSSSEDDSEFSRGEV